MADEHHANAPMWLGVVVFAAIGLKMIVQGILHTISGDPIPATSWTDESTGPQHIAFGLASLGLALVAHRLRQNHARKP